MRGIAAFLLVWVGGATLFGFGLGLPEMVGMAILAAGAFVLASRRTARERAVTS